MRYIATDRERTARDAIFAAYDKLNKTDRDLIDNLAMQLVEAIRARTGGLPRGFGHMSAIELLGKLAIHAIKEKEAWLFPESKVKRQIDATPKNYRPPQVYKR